MGKNKGNSRLDENFDHELFSYIQTQGGITFREPNYIVTGDGYVKVLHIYQLPPKLSDYWLKDICNIDGTVAAVDIATKDTADVKNTINKALKEEFSREHSAKDFMELYEARRRQAQLQSMYDEIQSMGEVVKMVHFRIFVSGRNLVQLEEKADRIMKNLESDQFMAAVMLNEGKAEWRSLLRPYKAQMDEIFAMKGLSLMTEQLAGGDPFHYSDLSDDLGTFLGFTPCGGPVIYDEYSRTKTRKHYNALAVGDMGSGKSTLLKKRFRARAERGDYIRCFDISSEFTELTREFGGKIIKCDGQHGMLNPLEILKAGDDDFTSFANHIQKVSAFYRCFDPSADEKQIIFFQNALRAFYEEIGLVPNDDTAITGCPAKSYPIFSDFKDFLEEKISELTSHKTDTAEASLIEKSLLQYANLFEIVKNMVDNFGRIFDGHTSIDNIVDEQIVTFDISTIKDLGNVFAAQLFNMVSLCWDNAIANGVPMKGLYEEGKIEFEDVTRFMILIDESHRWVNTRMPMILERIIVYMREARKYFAGIWLASQSMRDFMPEGNASEHLDLIKTVFELTQYKFMMHQDTSALPVIDAAMGNALTPSQRGRIPKFRRGECILSIAGDRNLELSIWLSKPYEEPIFKGGE